MSARGHGRLSALGALQLHVAPQTRKPAHDVRRMRSALPSPSHMARRRVVVPSHARARLRVDLHYAHLIQDRPAKTAYLSSFPLGRRGWHEKPDLAVNGCAPGCWHGAAPCLCFDASLLAYGARHGHPRRPRVFTGAGGDLDGLGLMCTPAASLDHWNCCRSRKTRKRALE